MTGLVKLGCLLVGLSFTAIPGRAGDFEASERCYQENKLDSAIFYINRAEARYNKQGNQDSLGLSYAYHALILVHREGTKQALRFIRNRQSVIDNLPENSVARLAVYNRLGQIYVQLYEFEKAAQYFRKAEQLIRKGINAGRHGVILYLSMAQMYLSQQKYALARQQLDKAYQLNLSVEGRDGLLMSNIWQTRYYLHYFNREYQKALADGLEYERLVKLHFADDHPNTAMMHNSLSDVYYALHQYDESLRHQNLAVAIHYKHFLKTGDATGISGAYSNLGDIYFGLHEFHLADQYLGKSLTMLKGMFGEYGPGIIETMVMLGSTRQSLDDMNEAEALFKEAYRLQQKYAPANISEVAYVEGYLGDFFIAAEQYDTAAIYYTKALDHYREIQEGNSYYALYAEAYLGKALSNIPRQQDALNRFSTYLPEEKSAAMAVMNEISLSYLSAAQPLKALAYSDSLFMTLMNTPRLPAVISKWFDALPYRNESCEYLVNRVEILWTLAQQEGGEKYLQQLLDIVNGYGHFFAGHVYLFRTQSALIEQSKRNKRLYGYAVEACWKLAALKPGEQEGFLERAFIFSEWSKALLLRLASNNVMVDLSANPGDAIARRDRAFRADISNLNEAYLNTSPANDSLLVAMTRKMEAYLAFQDSLRLGGDPVVFQKKYAIEPFSLNDIRNNLLKDGQTLLQYTVTDSSVFLFLVSADQYRVKRMDKSVLKPLLKLKDLHTLSASEFVRLAYPLYQSLISPVKPFLKGHELVIIPDGELFQLNFEVLVSAPGGTKFKDLPYLIRKYEISYLLSASSTLHLQKGRVNTTNGKGLVMVPVFDDKMKVVLSPADATSPGNDPLPRYLIRQPFALRSGKDIAGFIPSDLYTEFDARESLFKHNANHYSVLHLGTHAQTDNASPLHSRLFFAQPFVNDTTTTDDGSLYAYEVYNMQLRAKLAVLTACETGRGRIYQGEGMISLAHSFLYAGCASVVMSMWKIDEKTSAGIITEFYKLLSNGASKSSALRLAKLYYLDHSREKLANPYYWAGFGLIGDTAPIYPSPFRRFLVHWTFPIAAILLLITSAWLFLRYRKRK